MTLEVILGIITTLLAGTNIWQFIFIRQERQRYEAQANIATTEAKEKEVDLVDKKMQVLEEHLSKTLEAYKLLDEARKEDNEKHFNEVIKLREEIVSLRMTIGELTSEVAGLKEAKEDSDSKACDIATKCAKRVKKATATRKSPAKKVLKEDKRIEE